MEAKLSLLIWLELELQLFVIDYISSTSQSQVSWRRKRSLFIAKKGNRTWLILDFHQTKY